MVLSPYESGHDFIAYSWLDALTLMGHGIDRDCPISGVTPICDVKMGLLAAFSG
jgi:hypothetical protein